MSTFKYIGGITSFEAALTALKAANQEVRAVVVAKNNFAQADTSGDSIDYTLGNAIFTAPAFTDWREHVDKENGHLRVTGIRRDALGKAFGITRFVDYYVPWLYGFVTAPFHWSNGTVPQVKKFGDFASLVLESVQDQVTFPVAVVEDSRAKMETLRFFVEPSIAPQQGLGFNFLSEFFSSDLIDQLRESIVVYQYFDRANAAVAALNQLNPVGSKPADNIVDLVLRMSEATSTLDITFVQQKATLKAFGATVSHPFGIALIVEPMPTASNKHRHFVGLKVARSKMNLLEGWLNAIPLEDQLPGSVGHRFTVPGTDEQFFAPGVPPAE